MNSFDWQWWQYFLALAEHGSLSRAAEQLSVSQPTLSRQLLAMEKTLGQTLFDRSTKGLALTAFGQSLLEECQQMQHSAHRLQRLVQGQDQELHGRVRLSANELMALYYLPDVLPDFMARYPALSVEIEVSNRASSLDKRDADIALRMFRPTQLDLICRHLFDIELGFYAHRDYLQRYGTPDNPEALFQHRLLGYDRDTQFEEGARALGYQLQNEDFLFRTDSMPMHLEVARRGGGIVAGHCFLCERAGLQRLSVGIELPYLPLYLVCHRDVQHNRRIRVTMDYLGEVLQAQSDS
ncbi:MAG: LysR family transcriptional regulator [Reinekea sp.]